MFSVASPSTRLNAPAPLVSQSIRVVVRICPVIIIGVDTSGRWRADNALLAKFSGHHLQG